MIEHEGKHYARVSEILVPFSDYSRIDPVILDKKCKLGTSVHEAIDDFLNDRFPFPLSEGWGYFYSFEKWWDQIKPTLIETEKRYFCDDKMITGQIDALISLPGSSESIVLDFKTSAQESPTWELQGHLYRYLLSPKENLSSRIFFLKLDKNGGLPKLFEYKFNSNTMAKCLKAIDDFWKINES